MELAAGIRCVNRARGLGGLCLGKACARLNPERWPGRGSGQRRGRNEAGSRAVGHHFLCYA